MGGEQAPGETELAGLGDLRRNLLGEHRSPHVAGRSLAEDFARSFGRSSLTNEFSIIASNWVFVLPSLSGPPAASARRERASARVRDWRRSLRFAAPAARSRLAAKSAGGSVRARKRLEPLGGEARARRIGRAGHFKDDICSGIEGHGRAANVRGMRQPPP